MLLFAHDPRHALAPEVRERLGGVLQVAVFPCSFPPATLSAAGRRATWGSRRTGSSLPERRCRFPRGSSRSGAQPRRDDPFAGDVGQMSNRSSCSCWIEIGRPTSPSSVGWERPGRTRSRYCFSLDRDELQLRIAKGRQGLPPNTQPVSILIVLVEPIRLEAPACGRRRPSRRRGIRPAQSKRTGRPNSSVSPVVSP